jgi:DNA-binding MltR family transcriptional regulator
MSLEDIHKRFEEIKNELAHDGYTGDMTDEHVLNVIIHEILNDLYKIEDEVQRRNEIRNEILNMFWFGYYMK